VGSQDKDPESSDRALENEAKSIEHSSKVIASSQSFGHMSRDDLLMELKEQQDANKRLKAQLEAVSYMKMVTEEGGEQRARRYPLTSTEKSRTADLAHFCVKARTKCPCQQPRVAPKVVASINFASCQPKGGLICSPNLGMGTCEKSKAECSCPDHITLNGGFIFYGVPTASEIKADQTIKHYSTGFCAPWDGELAATGTVVCAPKPDEQSGFLTHKKFWCSQLMVVNPYGADGDIGVLAMKRVACIDNHCEVMKRARCFKCGETIYGLQTEGATVFATLELTALQNQKMARCAVAIMKMEDHGQDTSRFQCTGKDASRALMTAIAM